jgi:DNA-binding MarR family transcriptional regulator
VFSELTASERVKFDHEVETVVDAARVFSAVTAESIAQAGDGVTLPQLRVLTLASTAGSLNNSQVADALGVHISNASRICERLVQAGLLSRRDSPSDRRQVELTLTIEGRRVLDVVTNHRRGLFRRVLVHLSEEQRSNLGQALEDFTESADRQLETPHGYIP